MPRQRIVVIEASTSHDFHAAVTDAAEAISAAGGWIVSHQFYSNMLAVISFQIPGDALPRFAERLRAAGISPHRPLPETTVGGRDVAGQLSISFLQRGTDVRRPVPAFG